MVVTRVVLRVVIAVVESEFQGSRGGNDQSDRGVAIARAA
jgi:hypothetical protein